NELGLDAETARGISRICFIACGTSYHASLLGRHYVEKYARIPAQTELGSEVRYRDPVFTKGDLVIAVSQSGETLDTLAALEEAKRHGARTIALTNVLESAIARAADAALYTHAGPEIGVASTKAFTTQLVAMLMFSLELGRLRGTLPAPELLSLLHALLEAPGFLRTTLEHHEAVLSVARKWHQSQNFLFLGRGLEFPIALEGALKLKEISYAHAEGYAAGEMKHGPIALIDEKVPVIVFAPTDGLFDKTVSNMQEVMARDGRVFLVSDRDGLAQAAEGAWRTLAMPTAHPFVAPILYAVPAQLLAYHTAVTKGTDVDQPRNLAKSVTVE